jgi:hypothetical protein
VGALTDNGVITREVPLPDFARRLRRRWPLIVGVVVAVLAVAGTTTWRLIGEHPRLATGSNFGPDPGTVANDGISDTKLVLHMVIGRDYEMGASITNRGHFPVTVVGLATRDELGGYNPIASVSFRRTVYGPNWVAGDLSHATQTSVVLKPGQEATVRLVLRANPCWAMAKGTYTVLDDMPFRVRQLGVTTTQRVAIFHLPLYVTDDQPADQSPASCHN